ncbi:amastin-like surface protein-like protein [Angomonas deanei]|nr:amastin-like surface protein-like protein [Angomonas deanei]EPY42472.1 amastin-like surface protein-like protein [Angomonas deanei]|eukprot:EPY38974.1 amastin-like surface protein-like protein [Angomonas deanei]
MNAGAAFAIISIFVTLVALIFGIFMIVKIKCAVFIPLVLVAVSLVTILIAWACPASMKTSSICGWKWDYMHYGAGFGLMVTAWVLELLNLVFLIILACF